MTSLTDIYHHALDGAPLTFAEAMTLWNDAPLAELMAAADARRRQLHPDRRVTWQIDRNVNITNVCVSGCKFCSFHCRPADRERLPLCLLLVFVPFHPCAEIHGNGNQKG